MNLNSAFIQWMFLFLSVISNVLGVFIIKLQLNKLGPIPLNSFSLLISYFIEILKSPVSILGVTLFFLAPIFFAISLSRMQITVAYPIQVGGNFILLILLGFLILKEPFSLNKIIATILIIISVYLLYK